jgi:hypothetical protein
MRSLRCIVVMLAAQLVSGCEKSEPLPAARGEMVTRTDSAGVEIVQVNYLDTTQLALWTVDSVPTTIIGDDGRGEQHVLAMTFGQVRLGDGRVVIAMDNEIRQYDSTGAYIGLIARQGRGPGEFMNLSAIGLMSGDTVLAYERSPASITRFSPEGRYLDRKEMQRPRANDEFGAFEFTGVFPDGTVLVNRHPGESSHAAVGELVTDSVRPYRLDSRGNMIADYGTHWKALKTRILPVGVSPSSQDANTESSPVQVSGATWGPTGNRMFYTANNRFQIQIHGPDAKLRRLLRMNTLPVFKSTSDSAIVRWPTSARGKARVYDYGAVWPDTLPALNWVISDKAGNLWINIKKRAMRDTVSQSIIVVDSTGTPIARVAQSFWNEMGHQVTWRIPMFILGTQAAHIDHTSFTSAALDSDDRWHVLTFRIRK